MGILEARDVMRCGVRLIVGEGEWFRLLEDLWIGNAKLRHIFPLLFGVSAAPSARIYECYV